MENKDNKSVISSIKQCCKIASDLEKYYLDNKTTKEKVENEIPSPFEEYQNTSEMMINELKKNLESVLEKMTELKDDDIDSNPLIIPNLNDKQIKQLEDWTELRCKEILFDSDIDNWKAFSSDLNG